MNTQAWLQNMLDVTTKFALETLELEKCEAGVIIKTTPGKRVVLRDYMALKKDIVGVYLPLIGEHESVLIGLFSDRQGCRRLTGSFLKLDSKTETLSSEDTADALKEIVNILTGMLKEQDQAHAITGIRGLPVYTEGFLKLAKDQEAACALLELGASKAYLIVIRSIIQGTEAVPAVWPPRETHIQDWLVQALSAASSFTEKMLGFESTVESLRNAVAQEDVYGAYMPLIVERDAVLIGLLSNDRGFQALARMFLGAEGTKLTEEDLADTVKEALNIISGIIKDQMFGQQRVFRRGLPIFLDGYIELTEGQESSCVVLEIKGEKIYLEIIRKAEKGPH